MSGSVPRWAHPRCANLPVGWKEEAVRGAQRAQARSLKRPLRACPSDVGQNKAAGRGQLPRRR